MNSLEDLNFQLLELLGIGYVIEHYISYFHKIQKEKVYQIYITDTLRLITENTAKFVGGSYIKMRYADMIEPVKKETRTPEEIIENIRNKLRG